MSEVRRQQKSRYRTPGPRRDSQSGDDSVSVLDLSSRAITRGIAPPDLGDYYSWGRRGNRDLIMTVRGNYYFLALTSAPISLTAPWTPAKDWANR